MFKVNNKETRMIPKHSTVNMFYIIYFLYVSMCNIKLQMRIIHRKNEVSGSECN